jgi:hypothetical protein
MRQPARIELQNILMYDLDVRLRRKGLPQQSHQATVRLNGNHTTGLRGQQGRQRAGARADFQHGVSRRQIGRGCDARQVRLIYQEMLPQCLARLDAGRAQLLHQ